MSEKPKESERLLLRAELTHAGGRIVTHTVAVSPRVVTLACADALPLGTEVELRLSFPRLVRQFEVAARVSHCARDDGHGSPATITCEVTAGSDHALASLAAVSSGRSPEPAPPSGNAKYRCLLVEDNGFIRDLFEYGMDKYRRSRRAEVALGLAVDAEQAWVMLETTDYDMAIVDFYLPAQNGSELIARMRATPRLADMPVVAISVGGVDAREASMSAGADFFLDKPVVMRDLFATLDKLTQKPEEKR